MGDRDGLPSDVLSRMLGWPVVARLWLPAWIQDPTNAVDRLEEQLRTPTTNPGADDSHLQVEVDRPGQDNDSEASSSRSIRDGERIDDVGTPLSTVRSASITGGQNAVSTGSLTAAVKKKPFVPFESSWRGSRSQLDALEWSRSARGQVRDAFIDVVAAEGPVHEERAARLVAACFELTRLNAKRISSLLAQVPDDVRRGTEADVLWPRDLDPDIWSEHRPDPRAQRSIEHVSLTEIANAMASVAEQSGGMTREEAMRAALGEFGLVRMTPAVSQRLEAALSLAERIGRVSVQGGFVVAQR